MKSFKRYVYYRPDIDELCVVIKVPFKEKGINDLYRISYDFAGHGNFHKNYIKLYLVKIGEL